MRSILTAIALGLCLSSRAAAADSPAELRGKIKELLGYVRFKRSVPSSPREVELGRRLFFDPRLSRSKTMSCATCHKPSLHWTDGLSKARGPSGDELPRNTPSILTAVYHRHLFWDGKTDNIGDAPIIAILHPKEMNLDPKELLRIPGYARQFEEIDGPPGITEERIGGAIAAFMASIEIPDSSPFDRFLKDGTGIDESARRGFELFAGKANCRSCHVGTGFTDNNFRNIGLKNTTPPDLGRYLIDARPDNWEAFRTPSLRDVALTAPYMHDGSLKTLRDVVDFYDRGGDVAEYRDVQIRPLHLTETEKNDLVAFLNSLTNSERPVEVPPPPEMEPSANDSNPEEAAAAPPASVRLPGQAPDNKEPLDKLLLETARLVDDLSGYLSRSAARRIEARAAAAPPLDVGIGKSEEYCLHSQASVDRLPIEQRRQLYLCRALASDDPEMCSQLGPSSRTGISDVHACKNGYFNARVAQKIISGDPSAMDACMKDETVILALENPEERRRLCSLWVEGREIERSCVEFAARLSQLELTRRHYLVECLKTASLSSDVPRFHDAQKTCSQFDEGEIQKGFCPDLRAYRKAWPHKPSLCGDRPLCELFMGDRSACEREGSDMLAAYCGQEMAVRISSADSAGPGPAGGELVAEIENALRPTPGQSLAPKELEAEGRLYRIMLGQAALDPALAARDIATLMTGRVATHLMRAEALLRESKANQPRRAEREELDRLRARARVLSARARLRAYPRIRDKS